MHASLQTQGFLGNFVVGFLMTAFPRLTGTKPATKTEIGVAVIASAGFLPLSLANHWKEAEIAFLILIANLLVFAARRMSHRKKSIPPSFLLMGFGILHALVGVVLLWASDFGSQYFSLYSIGRQMVQLGFLLCIVLGVTARLTPFLMGYGDDPRLALSVNPSLTPSFNAVLPHALTGMVILISFWIEPSSVRFAWFLRALTSTFHLLFFARIARPLRNRTAFMFFFMISCWLIILGHWIGVAWPGYRIMALHIVFIGGFSLMIFAFGTNVILSHSSQVEKLQGKLVPMKIIGACIVIALMLRIWADLWPERYPLLIHLSSGTWVLVALGWLIYLFPRLLDVPAPHE